MKTKRRLAWNRARSIETPSFSTFSPRLSRSANKPSASTCRYIPNRSGKSENLFDHDSKELTKERNGISGSGTKHSHHHKSLDIQQEFRSVLAKQLFETDEPQGKLLSFKSKPLAKPSQRHIGHDGALRVRYSNNQSKHTPSRTRMISTAPERILDAPDLLDDYYLNLLHWSETNILAVGLGTCVYLWNAESGSIDLLAENEDTSNYITSIRWMGDGSHVAIGSSDAKISLWDVTKKAKVRTLAGHAARVSALAWNGHMLSSGSRDSNIFTHDVRVAKHHLATLNTHTEEICGLTWSPDGSQLASGGNDNLACVWDRAGAVSGQPARFQFAEHQAAVKALAWCPFQRHLLATGGGTADRHIRFFDTSAGTCVNAVDTKSQVCSLQWSKTEKELLSSHGFSLNQLTVWKYPYMTPIASLTGHTSRVLHTSLSPDGTTVVSAAGDETLRFWNIWPSTKKALPKTRSRTGSSSKSLDINIR